MQMDGSAHSHRPSSHGEGDPIPRVTCTTPSTQGTVSTQILATEQPSPWEHPGSKWLCPLEAPRDPLISPVHRW